MRTSRALGMISLVVILITQVGARRASGQAASAGGDAQRFIGTWRLVSDVSTGLMYYDSLGNMAAQVMPNRSRPKYAGVQPTPEEAKEAITGYLAYFGTYTVDESVRTITHHRKANVNRRYVWPTPPVGSVIPNAESRPRPFVVDARATALLIAEFAPIWLRSSVPHAGVGRSCHASSAPEAVFVPSSTAVRIRCA